MDKLLLIAVAPPRFEGRSDLDYRIVLVMAVVIVILVGLFGKFYRGGKL